MKEKESESSIQAVPMYEGKKGVEGQQLQVFVETVDYYSNPYTVLVVAANSQEAQELIDQAAAHNFRSPEHKGYYGRLEGGKLLTVNLTQAGIYVFEAPGDRNYR